MKELEVIEEAESIGADSWELMNFEQLPMNASQKRQIEALQSDHRWLRGHMETVLSRIEDLIEQVGCG